MSKYVLALNCGSSSVKFNLYDVNDQNNLNPIIQGIVEEIGNQDKSRLKYSIDDKKHEVVKVILSHRDALTTIFNQFTNAGIGIGKICAVGHRAVHGGDKYNESVLIDEKVIDTMRDLISIAPLHNPPNITGIEESIKLLPGVPQVAVFDTAYHAGMPEYAYRYAIPNEWYEKFGVRRYGFHGTSHMYVSRRGAKLMGIPYNKFNCITAHLGNGCSVTKIMNGRSVDTSMGFTPLEGVVMGTRSGDIDCALIPHVAGCLVENLGIGEADAYKRVMHALNKESGLKALADTNMMQDIRQKAVAGDVLAELVISIYSYKVAKYIGAYWATLPYVNSIIFTAGLGENEGYIRKKILSFLGNLNITVNEENNNVRKKEIEIGVSNINPSVPLSVMVIPTDEEIVIGYDAFYIGYLNQSAPEVYPFEIQG